MVTRTLDELRARHHPGLSVISGRSDVCDRCGVMWPCDAMHLGSALTAAWSRVGRLEASLERARTGRAKYRSELAKARERAAALEGRLKGTE